MKYSKEIQEALAKRLPVVALESTIISHGMPYPENVETGRMLEDEIRQLGAVPATIAIIQGQITVGLEPNELEYLGKEGRRITKVSRRDLPIVVSGSMDGATTVASTMIIAAMAGIRIFATGGIGGVHRGAQESMDISADLRELSMTSVAVVSAGVKSILDIGLTLEYLETMGVPVLSFGTDEFPAFYSRESGFDSPFRMDSPESIASMLNAKWQLGLEGGVLIANPVPEEYSYEKSKIDEAIDKALAEATSQNIKGKAVTPFLLSRIKELTAGQSLVSNIELARNNARLAARIAVAMHAMHSD